MIKLLDNSSLTRVWRYVKVGFLIGITVVITIVVSDYITKDPSPKGVVVTTMKSVILGQERELIIHLPQHIDSSATYPVVYVLDGGSQDDHIANAFDVLSAANMTSNVIVVGIPNMTAENRTRQLIPPFMKTDDGQTDTSFGNGDLFLSFMKAELFPFVEKHYPASHTRLLMGHSRGAILTMYSLLFDPEMFQGRFCFSAPYWRQDSILITKVSGFLRSHDSLQTFLYLSVGRNEGEKGFLRMSSSLKEFAPKRFTWFAEWTAGADHQNNAQLSAPLAIARWGEYYGIHELSKN